MGGGLTPSSLPQSLALTAAFVSSINIAGWFSPFKDTTVEQDSTSLFLLFKSV